VLHGEFDEQEQLAFGRELAAAVGYDFQRGRCDLTPHPFMTKFSLGDVRITTRVDRHNLGDCMFSMLHEAGHALYEQGIDRSFEGLPIAGGASSGVHESQSRLWENVVGRSDGFWAHYYPSLVAHFPEQMAAYGVDEFVRAINRVRPSLIRTEADEVTYNLHVMIRFDLEVALIEGNLSVADLPDAWHARYREDLGVSAPDHTDGVLQDVHWYGGLIGGAFQGYTLGNVMSAQFYGAAVRAHPHIPSDVSAGRFDDLRGCLTDNVYRHGAKFLPAELLLRATGEGLRIEPYLGYLREKYGRLYGIELGPTAGAGSGAAIESAVADARE
jgi:carboxypeptidase Taq